MPDHDPAAPETAPTAQSTPNWLDKGKERLVKNP